MSAPEQRIKLHNTPAFYVEYVKNWLAHEAKEKRPLATQVIVQDILTLIEVAASVLNPSPEEQGKNNINIKSDES